MVVVGPDGVLFAKNSDRDPNEAQILEWQARRTHQPGARLRCTWTEVDQVTQTHAVLLSQPFWMWGAEIGANEHGLVIGNEAVFTDQPYAKTGLTGMDLLRLALERATTAAEAVEVMVDLIERYGQGGGCGHEDRSFTYHNSFIAADPSGAMVLETAGRDWATEAVTTGARSISNGLTIDGFAQRHHERLKTHFSRCRIRRQLTQRRAATATTVGDMFSILRDHGTDGANPDYSFMTGAMSAPCMHAGGVAAASQTTASWVADLTPADTTHWVTATAAPCTGLFKPVSVVDPVDLGPAPTDRFDPTTLWWRHELLHRRAMRDPEAFARRFAPERDATEQAWLSTPPSPAEAFASADELLDRWTRELGATEHADRRPPLVRRYWRIRDDRAGLATNQSSLEGATT